MMECIFHFPNCSPLILNSFCHKSSSSSSSSSSFNPFPFTHSPVVIFRIAKYGSKSRVNLRPLTGLPETRQSESAGNDDGDSDGEEGKEQHAQSEFSNDYEPSPRGEATVIVEGFPQGSFAIVSACLVGLLTGISVVLFNNAVHEIRDYFWDGIQYRGASWLREEPIEVIWKRVILVPACGGLIVSMLNILRSALDDPSEGILKSNVKAALQPFLKAMAACITLGTGNSLGPEGPSVEIGASIAKGYGTLFDRSAQSNLSLVAAGSAAGISSGFNAAVAGCFFAVESVLWPSSTDSSPSLTNTTSMVILGAVLASVVSQVGLGSEPAFKVPEYDFRSPSEMNYSKCILTLPGSRYFEAFI